MIRPGQIWYDTSGKPIESHYGGVFFEDGVYYWYGANWDGPTLAPHTLPRQSFTWFFNLGITIYRSTDLVHWDYASTVLADVSFDPTNLLQPLNVPIRPKIIKNDATGKYILMAALTSPDFNICNDVIVAVGNSPLGPFHLEGKLGWQGEPNLTGIWNPNWDVAAYDAPSRIRGFDMSLYQDDDGKAYLIVARVDGFIYELSDDYLSVISVRKIEGIEGEAPALFKADGTYFLVISALTGWMANRNTYFTASSLNGSWTPRGPFAQGPRQETTFDSQVAFVLPVAGQPNAFIFIGDDFRATSIWDLPDIRRATHVWLPMIVDGKNRTMQVPWRDQWDLSVFAQA